MTQGWLVYTAAVCAASPIAGPPPGIVVRVGEREPDALDTGSGRPVPFRCDIKSPVRTPPNFLHPSVRGLEAGDPASHIRANLLPTPTRPETAPLRMSDDHAGPHQRASGTQAVTRALDILIAVADGPISLPDLVVKVGIPKQTCHRIATALVERGLLRTSGRSGYRLGPIIAELAEAAARQDGVPNRSD